MAWSYDSTTINTTTVIGRLNAVRFLVGDTDITDQQAQDEEVEFVLTQTNDNVYYAASFVAGTIASQYSRKVDVELDGAIVAKYSTLAEQYRKLSAKLKEEGQKYSGTALGLGWGGIKVSEIDVVRDDTDRVSPSFRRDRFRFPSSQDSLSDYNDDN